MALTLTDTAGSASANTYCSKADADTYHESHVSAATWTAATDANKNIALVMATRLLDKLVDWDGDKVTSTQALRWPRSNIYDPDGFYITSSTIPKFLKEATAEFARLLLVSDRTAEDDLQGFKSLSVEGAIAIEVDKYDRAQTMPKSVWQMVRYYGSLAGKDRGLIRC